LAVDCTDQDNSCHAFQAIIEFAISHLAAANEGFLIYSANMTPASQKGFASRKNGTDRDGSGTAVAA
jgi:hypothetical protein